MQWYSIQSHLVNRPGNIDAPHSGRIPPSVRAAPEELHIQIHTQTKRMLVYNTVTLWYYLTTLKVRSRGTAPDSQSAYSVSSVRMKSCDKLKTKLIQSLYM